MRFLWLFVLIFFVTGCSVLRGNQDSEENKSLSAAHANVKLSLALLKQGFVKEAKQKLWLAQRLDPKNITVWLCSAYVNERCGDREAAENAYCRAISLQPTSGAAHNNYGVFLYHLGHYRSALMEFKQAVQDPHYLDIESAYDNAGRCALKLK